VPLRRMYDSISINAIPINAQIVAGYVGGQWPTFASLAAHFPNAIRVSIAVNVLEDADVLDVERGDATPMQAVPWVQAMRNQGRTPTVYCNTSTWPAVKAAFSIATVPLPLWWRADYNGNPALEMGEVAHQYSSGAFDTSVVADYWPGIDDPPPSSHPKENAVLLFQDSTGIYFLTGAGTVHVPSVPDVQALEKAGVPLVPVSDTFSASLRSQV
jgi:hypothetical protein